MQHDVQEAQLVPTTHVLATTTAAEVAPASMFALGTMGEDEFEARLAALTRMRKRVEKIHLTLMTKDVDYGEIPGTRQRDKEGNEIIKRVLLKPGAEKLCQFYGYVPEFKADITHGDGETAPHITVVMTCKLHQGSEDGPVVGAGLGACNSWEKKYRYTRGGALQCPACSNQTLFRNKNKQDGGYFCWKQRGGCGTNFKKNDPLLASVATEGDGANPDPFDLLNTMLKMAEKRAHVGTTLRTTATSSLYSQDLEDGEGDDDEAPPPVKPAPAQKGAAPEKPAEPPEDIEAKVRSTVAGITRETDLDVVVKRLNATVPRDHPKRDACVKIIEARRAELKKQAA